MDFGFGFPLSLVMYRLKTEKQFLEETLPNHSEMILKAPVSLESVLFWDTTHSTRWPRETSLTLRACYQDLKESLLTRQREKSLSWAFVRLPVYTTISMLFCRDTFSSVHHQISYTYASSGLLTLDTIPFTLSQKQEALLCRFSFALTKDSA